MAIPHLPDERGLMQSPSYPRPEPSPYGMPYGAVNEATFGYNGGQGSEKGLFLHGPRRRLNWQPLLWGVLLPWALFAVVFGALSFSMHYETPGTCWAVVAAAFLVVLASAGAAFSGAGRWWTNAEREPTWLVFWSFSMMIAFVAALILGSANYGAHMAPYFNMRSLANYTDVVTTQMRGQQLMDAGVIEFAPGTIVDATRSMGFKNSKIYCVAPIVTGNATAASYDFWAVGTECCTGGLANFHCPHFNNPEANGGMRVLSDADRAFYRLAVQQAEAEYNIKALHPIFLEWSVRPMDTLESWQSAGRSQFVTWVFSYLVFQTFCVAAATLAFSRLGLK